MKISRKKIYQILIWVAVVATMAASVYALITGRRYFSGRNLRQIGAQIKTYGIWSPVIIFLSILLASLIPPLPIPISFLEISAGIIFGFWPGVILVWLSQVISALACFKLANNVGNLFVKKISESSVFRFYTQFLEKKGALAVFVIRATMSSPFSVSYLAGLRQIKTKSFLLASGFGVITEVVLFVFIGTLIGERVRIRLWYVFIFLLVLNYLPSIAIYSFKNLKNHGHKK